MGLNIIGILIVELQKWVIHNLLSEIKRLERDTVADDAFDFRGSLPQGKELKRVVWETVRRGCRERVFSNDSVIGNNAPNFKKSKT